MKVLTRKRQYLDAMGIDVWSVRPVIPETEERPGGTSPVPDLVKAIGAAPEARKTSEMTPEKTPSRVKTESADTPQFRFALLHYGSLGICISLGDSDKLPRRFCDDLARTMDGDVDGLRYHELTWPMLNTSGIDQSVNAAKEVVTQKLKTLPARVLVIGEDVAEYFAPLKEADAAPLSVGPQSFLLIPSIEKTAESPDIKRTLFVSLQAWRKTR